jgi:5'-3' exonuclease
MDRVSEALKYFINLKITTDKSFKDLKIILSDSSVPGLLQINLKLKGEGEHKVLEFVRTQRSQKGYNPNTKHVIVGLDADLIFLSLATHEPFFYILREEVFKKTKHPSYEFLRMEILREYIRKEFKELPSLERSIDDFVFMCMLVGNDFLPRLPSLDIQEGSIDTLISTYKMNFSKMGGYMCDAGDIDLKKLNMFISKLGFLFFLIIF